MQISKFCASGCQIHLGYWQRMEGGVARSKLRNYWGFGDGAWGGLVLPTLVYLSGNSRVMSFLCGKTKTDITPLPVGEPLLIPCFPHQHSVGQWKKNSNIH